MSASTDSLDTLHKVRRMWHWFLFFVLAGIMLGTCSDASAGECTTDDECVQQCLDEGMYPEEQCFDVLGPAIPQASIPMDREGMPSTVDTNGYGLRFWYEGSGWSPYTLHCTQSKPGEGCFTAIWNTKKRTITYLHWGAQ